MTEYQVIVNGRLTWGTFSTRTEAETIAKRLRLSGLKAEVKPVPVKPKAVVR